VTAPAPPEPDAAPGARPAAEPTGPLVSRVVTALRWSFVATVVVRLLSLGVSVALARLLGAEEFGVYAVALVALTAVLSLNELGVSVALVRYEGDERDVAPTVATLSLVGSLLCYAVIWFGAPHLAAAFGAPEATLPVRVMGLGVIVDGLVAVPAALLQRHFMQGRRAIADITNFGVGSALSVALAVGGSGAMSLAWGRIAGSTASAVLLLAFSPLPLRFGWARAHLGHLLRVGLPLAGASLLVFAILNLDYYVVGHTSGAVALGFYVLAFNLSTWPVTVLSQPIRKVTVPAFARLLADPPRLGRAVVDSFGGLMSVTVPVAACLGATAYPLVRVVYGGEWSAAAPVLVWLATLGAARVVLEFQYDVLVALGDTRRLLVLQFAWLVALAVALPVGEWLGGIVGVAVAHCAVSTLLVIPLHLRLISDRVDVRAAQLARVSLLPLATGALVVAVAVGAQAVAPDLVALAATAVAGGAVTLRALLVLRARARAMIAA
jgi:PST family polysaccharide transporter